MRGKFRRAGRMRPGGPHLASRCQCTRLPRCDLRCETQVALPAAAQLEIDLGQQFGVEQRPVLGAVRIVDVEALAQRGKIDSRQMIDAGGACSSGAAEASEADRATGIARGLSMTINVWGLGLLAYVLASVAIAIGVYRDGRRQLKAIRP